MDLPDHFIADDLHLDAHVGAFEGQHAGRRRPIAEDAGGVQQGIEGDGGQRQLFVHQPPRERSSGRSQQALLNGLWSLECGAEFLQQILILEPLL
jgi:hypothetical protein